MLYLHYLIIVSIQDALLHQKFTILKWTTDFMLSHATKMETNLPMTSLTFCSNCHLPNILQNGRWGHCGYQFAMHPIHICQYSNMICKPIRDKQEKAVWRWDWRQALSEYVILSSLCFWNLTNSQSCFLISQKTLSCSSTMPALIVQTQAHHSLMPSPQYLPANLQEKIQKTQNKRKLVTGK